MGEIAPTLFLLHVCLKLFLLNVFVILARKKPANKETDFPGSSNDNFEDHPLHN